MIRAKALCSARIRTIGDSSPLFQGSDNFDKIRIRFIKDDNLILESLKKGDVDFYDDMTADMFVARTTGQSGEKPFLRRK